MAENLPASTVREPLPIISGKKPGKRDARGVMRGARYAGRDTRGAGLKTRIPVSGQKTVKNQTFTKNRAARPPALLAQARAMFLTNSYIKNDMDCFT